jgi:hypothetical protein
MTTKVLSRNGQLRHLVFRLFCFAYLQSGQRAHRGQAPERQSHHDRGHRGFDILHVAAALHFGTSEFLTFDTNQRKLATTVGLKPSGVHQALLFTNPNPPL